MFENQRRLARVRWSDLSNIPSTSSSPAILQCAITTCSLIEAQVQKSALLCSALLGSPLLSHLTSSSLPSNPILTIPLLCSLVIFDPLMPSPPPYLVIQTFLILQTHKIRLHTFLNQVFSHRTYRGADHAQGYKGSKQATRNFSDAPV